MKPRTLARFAIKKIKEDFFIFDSEERKIEAIKRLKKLIAGRPPKLEFDDPIEEIQISVNIPNFDYPIIDMYEGEPYIWKENNKYLIDDNASHIVKAIGISGEKYLLHNMESLAYFRNAVVKVDRYTDMTRAAYALICCVSKILNKKQLNKLSTEHPLKVEKTLIKTQWDLHNTTQNYEKEQHHLYIKWLSKWICVHGKNPDTHMKVLKVEKNI